MDRPQTRCAQTGDLSIAYKIHGAGDHVLVVTGMAQSDLSAEEP